MIYLESVCKKENISNEEKEILDSLSNMIKKVITELSDNSVNKSSKEELFQYIVENTEIN